MTAVKNHDYNDLISGVWGILPPLGDVAIASKFEAGRRGNTAIDLAKTLILARVPGLDVSEEIVSKEELLVAEYSGRVQKGTELEFAREDIKAIRGYISKVLGKPPVNTGKTASLSNILDEARKRYSNLEDKGLVFSEHNHPKPFRSSLITSVLLQRVKGLDAGDYFAESMKRLMEAYIGVPKEDGKSSVSTVEAETITRDAREKTEAAITELLGPKKAK